MKYILLLFFFTSFEFFAQYSVEGIITDTTATPLPYSTVVLSKQSDSTMVAYAITDPMGSFIMEKVPEGDYIFQASFMGYSSYRKTIKVSGISNQIDMGFIMLKSDNELKELVVEDEQIPILFKKDTVEYNAGSFKTKKNDNVEGLLKKLPGVEVDEDGNVEAHGETVTKILVDGKEFFGDDPKIATKNIPADAIKKVQVFDKKSEISEFTGIDDGQRTRTINLTLKEDRKKGYFGDVMGGVGYENKYEAKLNLNRFSKTAQFTSLLMANNVNKQGFSFQDYFNFMGGISNVMKTGRMNFDPSSSGVPINTPGSNNGVANTLAGGINYNQDFGKKTHVISSFFVNNSDANINRETTTTNFIDDRSFISESTDIQKQLVQNYRLNAEVEHEFNEKNRLDVKTTMIYALNNTAGLNNERNIFSNNNNNQAVNDYDDNGSGLNGTIDLNYRKAFNKKGRTINFDGSFYLLNNANDRITDITRTLSFDSVPTSIDFIQIQDNLEDKKEYLGKVTFTEPLSRQAYLITDFSSFYQQEQNDKDFFDRLSNEDVKNQNLSNDFTSNYWYQQLGAKFNYKYKKNLFVVGLDGQLSRLKGTATSGLNPIDREFSVLLPNFYWKNQASMSNRNELRYTTSFSEPSVSQLQPVVNNTNPLNIYSGNPNLTPEFNHNLTFSYFKYDAFNFSSLSLGLSLTAVDNKIVNSQTIDANTNLRETTPINLGENYGGQASAGYSFRIKQLKSKFRTRINGGVSRGLNLINNIENLSTTYTYGGNINVGNINKKIIDINTGAKININENLFSLNKEANATYVNTKLYAEINVELKNDWSFGVEANQNFYTGSLYNDNPSFLILDAYVAKTILKNKRGDLKLAVSDALNQRTGLNFYGQQNYFTESNVNVLGRYIMLSFNYKIIKI